MSNNTGKDFSGSQLAKFYANKNILLTGSSGYLGKLIVQKLLRSCPDVKGIYLILRPKKKISPEERLEKILENPVFDQLKKERPDFRKKLHTIYGDLQYEKLGLRTDDRLFLINEINIVLHSAATVDFQEPMKTAININIRGTRELLELCEEMKHLQVVMVTSTAYSFCPRKAIGEYFMDPPVSPNTIIKMAQEMNEETLNAIAPKLVGDWPNTYTFTKAIMEDVVNSKRNKLPVGLYRPSIVMPTYKDPLECWTDNMNGPVAMAVGASTGIVHVIQCGYVKHEMVPGDYVVNGFLATAYDVYKKYKIENAPEKIIYNSVASTKYMVDSKDYISWNRKYTPPMSKGIWKMSFISTSCPVIYWFLTIILHYIPGLILDTFYRATGQKPRLLKIYNSWSRANSILQPFLVTTWKMDRKNLDAVWCSLNETDKKIFPFDISTVDWKGYYQKYLWGLKQYVLKEKMDEESLKKAYENQKRFNIYHKILMYSFYAVCIFVLWKTLSKL